MDVQEIVRVAGATSTPLIPVSSGPPHHRGNMVPAHGGAIVDFNRMNHILEIDAVSRYTRIEPGVRYPELIAALRKEEKMKSTYREPHSWALLEMFRIRDDRIVAVEATFIGVPYNMSSPWSHALDP